MANTLLLKRSSGAGKSPASADLQVGEIAVNTADGRLFTKRSDGSIFVINPLLGLAPQSVVIDAGSAAVTGVRQSVTVNNASLGQYVLCTLAGDQPNGLSSDEMELEPLLVYGQVTAANQVTFQIVCANLGGVFTGQRRINFYVG